MKKWINNYNLEIMTIILAIVFFISLFFWESLTLTGKTLLALLGFVVMEHFFLKTVGLTFVHFRKMAVARVLGTRQ